MEAKSAGPIHLKDPQRKGLWVYRSHGSGNVDLHEIKVSEIIDGAGGKGAHDALRSRGREAGDATDRDRLTCAWVDLKQGCRNTAAHGIEVAQLHGCPWCYRDTWHGRIHDIISGG